MAGRLSGEFALICAGYGSPKGGVIGKPETVSQGRSCRGLSACFDTVGSSQPPTDLVSHAAAESV
jgi:hypothetical protein